MDRCGFCSFISGLFRRSMCTGERRNSTDSYYMGQHETVRLGEESQSDGSTEDLSSMDENPIEEPFWFPSNHIWGVRNRVQVYGHFLTAHKRRRKRLLTQCLTKDKALLDDIHHGQIKCILNRADKWSFNAFMMDNVSGGHCLPVLCLELFEKYNLIKHFNMDVVNTLKLLRNIEDGYHHINPYHNSVHATDVTQAMHCFLQQKEILDYLKPEEILAALLAAMAHDIDHPGVNQSFLMSKQCHLSTLYRNGSILENHHWRSALSCILESGLLEEIHCDREEFKRLLASLILATDITRQPLYLDKFKGHLNNNTLDMKKKSHRCLVLQMALKCADISNPCRPWEISRMWSKKVCEEFFLQGDWERRMNYPISRMCDRYRDSIPKIQSGFLRFVVTPLVTEWHRFLQNDLSTEMLQNLRYNQSQWDVLVAKEAAERNAGEGGDGPAEAAPAPEIHEPVFEVVDYASDTEMIMILPPRRSLYSRKHVAEVVGPRRFSMESNTFKDDRSAVVSLKCDYDDDIDDFADDESEEMDPPPKPRLSRSFSQESLLSEPLPPAPRPAASLARQQTFPPFEPIELTEIYKSEDEVVTDSSNYKEPDNVDFTEEYIPDDLSDLEKENLDDLMPDYNQDRRESAPAGNVTNEDLLRRRKSMPEDTTFAEPVPKDKKSDTSASALPSFLRRTLSGKDCWSRRRGSEPVNMTSTIRSHSATGARKITNNISSWLTKVHEKTKAHLPRRLSLPDLNTGKNLDEEFK